MKKMYVFHFHTFFLTLLSGVISGNYFFSRSDTISSFSNLCSNSISDTYSCIKIFERFIEKKNNSARSFNYQKLKKLKAFVEAGKSSSGDIKSRKQFEAVYLRSTRGVKEKNNVSIKETYISKSIHNSSLRDEKDEFYFESLRVKLHTKQLEEDLKDVPVALSYWREDVFPSAVAWLRKVLKVKRVKGPLKLERLCHAFWVGDEGKETWTERKCSELNPLSSMCGMATIPSEHFSTIQLCKNKPDQCEDVRGGSGIDNSDTVLYVTAKNGSFCTAGTLGFANFCRKDKQDRPLAGNFNLCPEDAKFDSISNRSWRKDVSIVLHEIFHVLGFSSEGIAFFRDKFGNPRTPRKENGEFPLKSSPPYVVPSQETVKTFVHKNGKKVKMLVTPAAKLAAREHFGCDTAEGLPLENEGEQGTKDDHIDKVVGYQELMAGTMGRHPVVTRLSLSVLEDSGWYKPEYLLVSEATWGSKKYTSKGCDILNGDCITIDSNGSIRPIEDTHFCTTSRANNWKEFGCSEDFQSQAVCRTEIIQALPAWANYFPPSYRASPIPLVDFCPVYESYYVGSQKTKDCDE